MLPLMERDGHADGDGLRDAVAARGEADALEAVDDEHSEVATHFRLWQIHKQITDIRKDSGISSRITSRRTPDR